ncbi:MAG: metal ABC transporter permease [Halolamina sp.]
MLCYAFMGRAALVGLCIGVVGPLIGTFLVHRRMALIGDSLAHTAFTGVAIGLFLAATTGWDGSPLLAVTVVTVIAALLIQYLAEQGGEYGDVADAIVLTGAFALGTVLVSLSGGISVSIASYLFGSIVTGECVRLLGGLTALVVGIVALTYKQLLFVTLDEEAARVARFDVSLYNRLLVVLTTLVVVGITLSYHYDLATGGTIVLAAIAVYGAATLWASVTGGRPLR